MPGTIIITGANGSLAVPAIQLLLKEHPEHTLILTARNAQTLTQYTGIGKVCVQKLDLADLSAVHTFADTIAADIEDGKIPPLTSIICNAYFWNLRSAAELTGDGYEKTFQVNHIAHAALVLRLLGSFNPVSGGRIVLFSSDAHWPGKNSLEKYPPAIPDASGIQDLVKPPARAHEKPDHMGRGFQRYATSKLAVVMWMYALNRRLAAHPTLNKITAVAVNPGNLADSRALKVNTPSLLSIMSMLVIRPFLFLLRRIADPTMRTCAEAADDIVDLATRVDKDGAQQDRTVGYYTMGHKDVSAPESQDETKQELLWGKTAEWAEISNGDSALLL
ncbi:NAD(P)-binding protein [Aspergillus filifer]